MSSESVCHVARSWVDMGSFHARLFIIFMIFKASVWNVQDIPSYILPPTPAHLSVILYSRLELLVIFESMQRVQ
jgi:hypothetical protein